MRSRHLHRIQHLVPLLPRHDVVAPGPWAEGGGVRCSICLPDIVRPAGDGRELISMIANLQAGKKSRNRQHVYICSSRKYRVRVHVVRNQRKNLGVKVNHHASVRVP